MTLCEVATAKHNFPPLECAKYKIENEDPGFEKDETTRGECVECVEANPRYHHANSGSSLARSPQYWSSYSGYLREVRELLSRT